MNTAIAAAPAATLPEETAGRRKLVGALVLTLLAVLAISALTSERSHAAACDGAPLLVAEFSLPALTEPA